jgi:hypothetical protein
MQQVTGSTNPPLLFKHATKQNRHFAEVDIQDSKVARVLLPHPSTS